MSAISKMIRWAGHKGLYALARVITRRQPKLLMYHHFSEQGNAVCTSREHFREQVAYIAKYFRPVTVSQLASEYYDSDTPFGNGASANTVAITVDDGYLDFYEVAFPILKEFKVPATFYVTTGFVEGEHWLWTDQLHWLFETKGDLAPAIELPKMEFEKGFSMPSAKDDARSWVERSYALNAYLLTLDNDRKWQVIDQLAKTWELNIPMRAPGIYRACSLEQLKEMQDWGVEIGGHTVAHPSLGRVSVQEAEKEIVTCYKYLERNLGVEPRSFCYPNGTPEDYCPAVKLITQRSGFSAAVTAFADSIGLMDRFAIRRNSGGDDLFQFFKAINGVEMLGHHCRGSCRKEEKT